MWTKMITSGVLFGVGDLVSQYFTTLQKKKNSSIEYNVKFDFSRTFLFAAFGCFLAAPLLNFHYGTILPFIRPGTDVTSTLIKVGVD